MITRQQGMAIGVGAALALMCAGISVVLVLALMKSNENKAKLETAAQDLKRMYQAKIFPDDANIAQTQTDQKTLEAWLGDATNELAKSEMPMKKLSPSQFKDRLEEEIREMVKQASASGKAGRVAADFRFGFDKYKEGVLPPENEAVVSRLNQQLDIIRLIVDELYAANINKLEEVGREVFEDGETAAAQPSQPQSSGRTRNRSQAVTPSAGGGSAVASSALNPALEGLFDRQRFTVQFQAYPEAFADVLNRLSVMPLFIVVSDMEMKKTGDSILRTESKPNAAKPKEEAAEVKVQVVTDPRREPPVSVRLSLDVYSFKGE